MKIDLSQFRDTFMQESGEHVLTMESGLFELRSAPKDMEILNAIFRSAHSIKGGAGSFGLTHLVRFTHVLESLLDRLRSMEIPVTEEIIGVLLAAVDVLRALLDTDGGQAPPENMAPLLERLRGFIAGEAVVAGEPRGVSEAAPTTTSSAFKVHFSPRREMFSSGTNPLVLLRNLASLGSATTTLHIGELPSLQEIDSEKCYLSWTIDLVTSEPEAGISEVFEFVEHLVDLKIETNTEHALPAPTALALPQLVGEPATTDVAVVPKEETRLSEVDERKTNRRASNSADTSSIRVTTDKVDRLIDLVGEPNITLQVMPFKYGGHAADGGAFTIMRFPETDLPDVVYMEYLTGAHYIDKPDEVERYAAVMERLSVAGTSPDRTREILSGMLKEI